MVCRHDERCHAGIEWMVESELDRDLWLRLVRGGRGRPEARQEARQGEGRQHYRAEKGEGALHTHRVTLRGTYPHFSRIVRLAAPLVSVL
jgi:hypothetical protein